MATLNQIQSELISNYSNTEIRTYAPYTKAFTEFNPIFYATTVKISIDDMLRKLYKAKSFDRDSAIPTMKRQPHTRMTFEPQMLGGKLGIGALDGIAVGPGQLITVMGGEVVDNGAYDRNARIVEIKTGVTNSLGDMCGEVFKESKITSLKGEEVDFDPTNISDKGNLTINPAHNETLAVALVEKIQEYWEEHGLVPSVTIGKKAINQIMSEINASEGKLIHGDYTMTQNGEDGFAVKTSFMNISMKAFAPTVRHELETTIDTSAKIQFHHPKTFQIAYGVLEIVDASDQPALLRGEVAVDFTDVNRETARNSVFVKSAPLPVVIDNNLIWRYDLVIS